MALRDDILARWGQYGEWDAAGVDRADELARLLQANGITDLAAFDNAKLKQTPYTYSGVWGADPESGEGGQQMEFEGWDRSLQLGDNTFGFLGNVGRGGAFEANTAQPFLKGTEDPNSYLLGWSAQGKGNTSYNVVTTPEGKLVVVPTWGSSSDWGSVRDAATVVGGALLAGYGLNGALGAGAGAGAGSTVGMTGAEAAAGMLGTEAGIGASQLAGGSAGLLGGGSTVGLTGAEAATGLLGTEAGLGAAELAATAATPTVSTVGMTGAEAATGMLGTEAGGLGQLATTAAPAASSGTSTVGITGAEAASASGGAQAMNWGQMVKDYGPIVASILGAVASGRDQNQTASREPWAPAQPFLQDILSRAGGMLPNYLSNPMSPQQQQFMNNAFGMANAGTAAMPGLLANFNATGGGYNRRGGPDRTRVNFTPLTYNAGLLGNTTIPGGR